MRKDKYLNFEALAAAEKKDEDYAIDSRRADHSPIIILAPHGGSIEPLTDRIADRIAGQDFSFYAFRGLKPRSRLHITSSHFDEPSCVDLLSAHDYALSIHGWSESGERICIGGRDNELMAMLKSRLVATGIAVEDAIGLLRGADPLNIVNRCRSTRGVQVELTMSLRRNLKVIDLFVQATRSVLKQLEKLNQCG